MDARWRDLEDFEELKAQNKKLADRLKSFYDTIRAYGSQGDEFNTELFKVEKLLNEKS